MSSSRNEPSKRLRTKLGARHTFSRAASATSRASCSEPVGPGPVAAAGARGGAITSVMGRGLRQGEGELARATAERPAQSVQHEVHDVPPSALQLGRRVETDADGGRDGARVDERKPAERDDTEQEL